MNKRPRWRTKYTVRKFWQRALAYFVMGILSGLLIYWAMARIDPASILEPSIANRGRAAMARLMLAVMSPASWGWFWFLLIVVAGFVGDWYYFRFQNLPPWPPSEE